MRNYNNLVKVAAAAACRGAAFLRAATRPASDTWTEKAQHDFVTEIDRGCEALIAEALTSAVPGSRVVGEELSPELVSGDVVWIVDPLDGTTNFLHGFPEYAVSIGCVVSGALCAGVVHDVARDVVYRAAAGGGAWMNDVQVQVSEVAEPKRALIATGFPFRSMEHLERYLRQFAAVARTVSGIRRPGSAALDLSNVAAGRFDAFWELGLAPWDIAAGIVLIREAGGTVTRSDGSEDVLAHGDIVAGNPRMHEWLLTLLRQAS
ncbi:MAG: inositol monophosphatase family protein [Gemmatimonadales bacterium]|nr:inositol monophosphatase family protein [Gemmatimonadales bacterium]